MHLAMQSGRRSARRAAEQQGETRAQHGRSTPAAPSDVRRFVPSVMRRARPGRRRRYSRGRQVATRRSGLAMSVGTAFHPRTRRLNRKMQWREWAGYFASSVVRRLPRHRVQRDPRGGRRDRRLPAVQVPGLPARTRRGSSTASSPATRRSTRSGRSSTRRGATSTARSSTTAPSTASARTSSAGRRPTPSCAGSARTPPGLDVQIEDVTEAVAALALQGPFAGRSSRPRRASRSRTCATSAAARRKIGGPSKIDVESADRLHRATSATSCGSRPSAAARSGTRC